MNITGMDKLFQNVKVLKCISIMWIRRYYNFDEFQIETSVEDWDNRIRYLFRSDRDTLMVAYKVQYENTKSRGRIVLVSGYEVGYMLNNCLIYPRYNATMNISRMTYDLYNKYADDFIKSVIKYDNVVDIGTSVTIQESNENLGNKLYLLLQLQELSWRISYDSHTDEMQIIVWQGLDRTQDQDENAFVTWSTEFRNIYDIEYTIDDSAYKNYAVVVGNGAYEDGNQITVYVDKVKEGEEKRILYVDDTSNTYDSTQTTLAAYKATLTKKGEEELEKHQKTAEVTFHVIDNTFKYLEDYDLGDKCDINISEINEAYSARITEIKEIYKNGNREIELTFGEKQPTLWQKARRLG